MMDETMDMERSNFANAQICSLHKQWDDILCPICMDHPHNAVLLLCSSYENGCRSYICDTSYRHSNCLDRLKSLRMGSSSSLSQTSSSLLHVDGGRREHGPSSSESHITYRRIRRNMTSTDDSNSILSSGSIQTLEENSTLTHDRHLQGHGQEMMDHEEPNRCIATIQNIALKCPLCRGTVFSWKIAKEVREYLDLKPRNCSCESCDFSGNYMELRRHARRVHPAVRPAEVEPSRQRAWRHLERQHEYGDIVSAIQSVMPGSILFGDYAIDDDHGPSDEEENIGFEESSGPWGATFFLLHMIGSPFGSLDGRRRSSSIWRTYRRRSSERQYLWGANLLGLQDEVYDIEGEQDNPIGTVSRTHRSVDLLDPQDEVYDWDLAQENAVGTFPRIHRRFRRHRSD